jgi:hypothetical protein
LVGLLNAALNLRIVFTFIFLFESGLLGRNLIVLGSASEDEQRGNQREEGRGKSHKGHSITIFGFSPQEKNSAELRLNRLRRAGQLSDSRPRVETVRIRDVRLGADAGNSDAPQPAI